MSSQAPPLLKRTSLFGRHEAAGAKLVDFAGWEMPLHYAGSTPVRSEHIAVRQACGIFDVSHMGEIETSGPQALELLQLLLSNDVAAIPIGRSDPSGSARAQYSRPCPAGGGALVHLLHHPPDT